MEAIVGTSGWQYADWRGAVYPADLPTTRWLAWYADRFGSVEVNSTFYRLPDRSTFRGWARAVPEGFTFAVKASRYITHIRRLQEVRASVRLLRERASALGDHLGPILFQLPPTMRRDTERLARFLDELPPTLSAAIEFRHPSWRTPDVAGLLDAAGVALVWPDRPRQRATLPVTARTIYVRFHQGRIDAPDYPPAKLRRWAERLAAAEADADTAYLYFNNDAGGAAVRDALALRSSLGAALGGPTDHGLGS